MPPRRRAFVAPPLLFPRVAPLPHACLPPLPSRRSCIQGCAAYRTPTPTLNPSPTGIQSESESAMPGFSIRTGLRVGDSVMPRIRPEGPRPGTHRGSESGRGRSGCRRTLCPLELCRASSHGPRVGEPVTRMPLRLSAQLAAQAERSAGQSPRRCRRSEPQPPGRGPGNGTARSRGCQRARHNDPDAGWLRASTRRAADAAVTWLRASTRQTVAVASRILWELGVSTVRVASSVTTGSSRT